MFLFHLSNFSVYGGGQFIASINFCGVHEFLLTTPDDTFISSHMCTFPYLLFFTPWRFWFLDNSSVVSKLFIECILSDINSNGSPLLIMHNNNSSH